MERVVCFIAFSKQKVLMPHPVLASRGFNGGLFDDHCRTSPANYSTIRIRTVRIFPYTFPHFFSPKRELRFQLDDEVKKAMQDFFENQPRSILSEVRVGFKRLSEAPVYHTP
ncbi:hypothetical protein TNCV_2492411 [Trichonephila clavipes]|nr:hypothetical protein TNCV_2492411 [Trichonephila clavipes]